MLKIAKGKRQPFWLDASEVEKGLRFHLAPITPAMILAARSTGSGVVLDGLKDAKLTSGPAADAAGLEGRGEAAFTRSIVQAGMIAWEGVGDEDGKAIDPSPEAIDALLENWRVFNFLDRRYVNPALTASAEKNGSSLSRNGTSGARTRARTTASIARPAAEPARTG